MKGKTLTIALLFLGAYLNAQTIFFVSTSGDDSDPGTTWNTAVKSLQIGIDKAYDAGGGQVWVESGTYMPTLLEDETVSFELKNHVEVYGGFAGGENNLDERDYLNNETILSGLIDTNFKSYHVVTGNVDRTAILDGFTIEDGDASLAYPNDLGGGIYIVGGKIRNCKIRDCAASGGGGVFAENSYFFNCEIYNNNSMSGGGIHSDNCEIYNSKIYNNISFAGAGIEMKNNSFLVNSLIYDNEIQSDFGNGGSGIYSSGGTIINCTIADNSSVYGASGIQFEDYDNNYLINSIIYNNTGATQLVNRDWGTRDFDCSCYNSAIENENSQTWSLCEKIEVANLASSPFNDQAYNLKISTVCINAGVEFKEPTSTEYPFIYEINGIFKIKLSQTKEIDLPSKDVFGNDRISGDRIDIGATEFQGAPTKIEAIYTESESLFVFPNPAKNILNFAPTDNADISIYSIQGKLVISEKKISTNCLDISTLSSGIYIVYVKNGEKYYSRSFIKEN